MSKNEPVLLKLNQSHLKEVARCHILAFPQSFSSKLGELYVKRMLEWYLVSQNRFLLGIKFKSQIVGYVGSAKGYGSTSAIIQYTFWQGFFSLLKQPYLIFRLISLSKIILICQNILRRIVYTKKNSNLISTKLKRESKVSIGLVVIGVHSSFRNQGIGSMLLKGHFNECKSLQATSSHLSVKNINSKAINVYKKNGWKIINKDKTFTAMSINII